MREESLEDHGLVKYPWDEWTDGDEHVITQGVDFAISIASMRAALTNKHRQRGLGTHKGFKQFTDGKWYYCYTLRTWTKRDKPNELHFQYIWKESDFQPEED